MKSTGAVAGRLSRLGPHVATAGFTALLATTAVALLVVAPPSDRAVGVVSAVALGAAFFVTEAWPVHIPTRRESHSVSLVEIPIVVGLAFMAPLPLVAARLVGSASALVLIRRQRSPIKLSFNIAVFALETIGAITVYASLLHGAEPTGAGAWVATAVALIALQTIGALAVAAVIWINGSRPEIADFAHTYVIGLVGAAMAAAWGLVTVAVIATAPSAAVPLGVLALGALRTLKVFGRLNRRHNDLKVIHSFTMALDGVTSAEELPGLMVEVANAHFMTSTAILASKPGGQPRLLVLEDDTGLRALSPQDSDAFDAFAAMLGDGAMLLTPDMASAAHNLIGTSIVSGAGVAIPTTHAFLILGNPRPGHSIESAELNLLQTLATHAGSVFERHRLFGALADEVEMREYQALHDELTDLPNRTAFLESVDGLLGRPHSDYEIAVMLLDIDDFKAINDTLSHSAGDTVLVDLAKRLRVVLRSADIVARVGGDEFAAAIGVGSDADAIAVAQRIKDGLQHPFISGGLRVEVGASIGIAVGAANAITMLRQADIAMYAAKQSDAGIEVYRDEIDDYNAPRLELAGELREAIDAGQVVVYYQPKVRPSDGGIIGFEALARWIHPTRGIVSPVEFIPIAEQTGLMTPFTEHILSTALRDAASWPDPDWTVSVNFSARTLVGTTAQHMVSEALDRTGVPAHRLVVEVTESGILQDRHGSTNAVEELHQLGVRISIDDFGTGYSSLSRLRTLPIDELKIDRSFISTFETDPGNRAIVETTITLAQRLGLTTVAEGAEEVSTVEELQRLGIDEIQGYFYSPPLPMDRLLEWIAQHEGRTGLRAAS